MLDFLNISCIISEGVVAEAVLLSFIFGAILGPTLGPTLGSTLGARLGAVLGATLGVVGGVSDGEISDGEISIDGLLIDILLCIFFAVKQTVCHCCHYHLVHRNFLHNRIIIMKPNTRRCFYECGVMPSHQISDVVTHTKQFIDV